LLFSATNDFAVSFWATLPDFQSGAFVGSEAAPPGWAVMLASNGLSGWWSTDDGANVSFTFGSASDLARQNHCVVVFSATAGVIQGYLNGALVGQQLLPADQSALGDSDIVVGGFSNPGNPEREEIGEVTIWKRALAASEVVNLYRSAAPGFQSTVAIAKFGLPPQFPMEPLSIVHSTVNDLKLLQTVIAQPPPVPAVSYTPSLGSLQTTIYGQPGIYYTLQSSSDLQNWSRYRTNVLEGSTINIPTAENQMFFRAVAP
jgi:hypothetical protein